MILSDNGASMECWYYWFAKYKWFIAIYGRMEGRWIVLAPNIEPGTSFLNNVEPLRRSFR
jgi:hypothetical protein